MKILVAGATGAVGARLLPVLVSRGHEVAGLARSAEAMQAVGVRPYTANALDRGEVIAAAEAFAPEVVVNQLTALSSKPDIRKFDEAFAMTNRLRTEGNRNLIAAARAARARRFIAQSFCGWPYERMGGPAKSEDDSLDPDPPKQVRQSFEAIRQLEEDVTSLSDIESVALRYGYFYGSGTVFANGGSFIGDLRRRRIPLVGQAGGIYSFAHVDDVASATAHAIKGKPTGIFNVVDDDPAPMREWLPFLAWVMEAKPPLRLPGWLARLVLPEHLYLMMTDSRGGSNQRFKEAFDWQPRYASWRQGFIEALG
jgi:nucleoside-diphosphate-sugar epimerase